MPDRRSGEPLEVDLRSGESVTALWLVPIEQWRTRPWINSTQEQVWAADLRGDRAERYRLTRSWLRCCLADRLLQPPECIPLHAPPGRKPSLAAGWGHVSLSHTCDALLLAWSTQPIGVDLERADRQFNAPALARRFFAAADHLSLLGLTPEDQRREVLRQWLAKEAAIKWQGGTLGSDLSSWSCPGRSVVATHQQCGLSVEIQQLSCLGWWMAIAGGNPARGQNSVICLI